MIYRYVKLPHYICKGEVAPEVLADFGVELPSCPQALVAYKDGQVAAFARFELTHKHLWGGGIWVQPDLRRCQYGSYLWEKILTRYKPEKVTIRTVTLAGRRWVGQLIQDSDPSITWSIEV